MPDISVLPENSSVRVDNVRRLMPGEELVCGLSDFFKVMGDPTRINILWALEKGALCVNELAAVLNMTKSAVSHQLKILRTVNAVKYRRQGKVLFYSLADPVYLDILAIGVKTL